MNCTINSHQLRFHANSVEPYGEDKGVLDITMRSNIQLRRTNMKNTAELIDGLHELNQNSFQSALDNRYNMVEHPLTGIDNMYMVYTREI